MIRARTTLAYSILALAALTGGCDFYRSGSMRFCLDAVEPGTTTIVSAGYELEGSGQHCATFATPRPTDRDVQGPDLLQETSDLLSDWLDAHASHLESARGIVTVRFTLAADGEVHDPAVVSSTGPPELDEAALEMASRFAFEPDSGEPTDERVMEYRIGFQGRNFFERRWERTRDGEASPASDDASP